ncbi:MAG: lysine 5,6-aminomutase subunit alpha TIM-barrel domain-containing protein, partial [Bacilli bacterium]
VINGFAQVIINTGEDNYLTTSDAITSAHTVLASQFINEQFALKAGMKEEYMGLGHAYEIDPELKDSFVLELAQAQMARQIFDKAPLKYMPPTKFMSGNIFKGQVQDALFNMVSVMTNQKIHLLGMMSEAIHTPFISDRYLALENAQYIFNAMASLGDEIEFKQDGIVQKRCDEVLEESLLLLERIAQEGLFSAIEKGLFADVKRASDGGKGLDGVTSKDLLYFNPFIELMKGSN